MRYFENMNVIRKKDAECRGQHDSNIEKNANEPISLEGLNSKHSNLDRNNKIESFNAIDNGTGTTHQDDSSSCPRGRNIDLSKTAKPDYLLDIPSPDVIQKRLLQLSTAFSRTQLSTLFDFRTLNNGRQNSIVCPRLFSSYFASSTSSSRLSIDFRNNFKSITNVLLLIPIQNLFFAFYFNHL